MTPFLTMFRILWTARSAGKHFGSWQSSKIQVIRSASIRLDFDNVAACRYHVPDYWTIGEVYERLKEDISGDSEEYIIDRLIEVYTSWMDDAISNYNTDFYYQSREYICECYWEGRICA